MNDVSSVFLSDANIRNLANAAMSGFGTADHIPPYKLRNSFETEIMAALQTYPPMQRPEQFSSAAAYQDAIRKHVTLLNETVLRTLRTRVAMNAYEFEWQSRYVVAGAQPLSVYPVTQHVVKPQVELTLGKRLMGEPTVPFADGFY